MDREELIKAIKKVSPSIRESLLAKFNNTELEAYLEHLGELDALLSETSERTVERTLMPNVEIHGLSLAEAH